MITIGIDQSIRHTGISLLKNGVPVEQVVIECKKSQREVIAETLAGIRKFLIKGFQLVTDDNEDFFVVREDYSYGSTGQCFELGELGGAINKFIMDSVENTMKMMKIEGVETSVRHVDFSYMIVPINTWKKFIFGTIFKKDSGYLLKVFKHTGLEFDDDNKADSFMLALTICRWIKFCTGETPISELTNDRRFASILPATRKKKKITDANVKKVSDEEMKDYIRESIDGYTIFSAREALVDTDGLTKEILIKDIVSKGSLIYEN